MLIIPHFSHEMQNNEPLLTVTIVGVTNNAPLTPQCMVEIKLKRLSRILYALQNKVNYYWGKHSGHVAYFIQQVHFEDWAHFLN